MLHFQVGVAKLTPRPAGAVFTRFASGHLGDRSGGVYNKLDRVLTKFGGEHPLLSSYFSTSHRKSGIISTIRKLRGTSMSSSGSDA